MRLNFLSSSLTKTVCVTTFAVSSLLASSANAATKAVVDAKASVFEWKGSKVTGNAHNGKVAIKEGEVEMDGNKLLSGRILVDMTTITNDDLTDKAYNDKLVAHLKSDDFFDVAKYPTAAITIKSSELQKDGSYKVKGDLQIKNETHPVDLVAKVSEDKRSTTTELTIDRTKWNVRYGSGKFFKNLGDKMISDNMEFKVNLVFTSPVIATAAVKKK